MARNEREIPRLPSGSTGSVGGLGLGMSGDPALLRAMRRRRLMNILFVGLGMAVLFGGLFVLLKIASQQQGGGGKNQQFSAQEQAFDSVTILAANTKIVKGSKIVAENVREIRWPRDQIPEGAVRSLEEIDQFFTTTDIGENQPLLRSSLTDKAPMTGIGDLLPPGHRAVTISVNATTGVEGWATPGAHVDVLLTYLDKEDSVNKTRVVVENAIVLSYAGSTKVSEEDDSRRNTANMGVSTVTLGVPFADSLKIQTAISLGRISLALRNVNDSVSPGEGVFTAEEWDRRKPPPDMKKSPASKGYARITGQNGSQKQYILGNDDRWQTDAPEDLF